MASGEVDEALREGLSVPDLLLRFEAARDLGMVATGLQIQADRILESVDMLQLDEITAPEGWRIRLNATHPEDPLETERYMPDSGRNTPWKSLDPKQYYMFPEVFGHGDREVTTFLGNSIAYDQEERKIYVYDKDETVRVLYRAQMYLSLIGEGSAEREVKRRQQTIAGY